MKDIGYYAGFLTDKEQVDINSAETDQLLALARTLILSMSTFGSGEFEGKEIDVDSFWLGNTNTQPNKLALIRGLCDRIEIKLMEQAK